jgi:NAD(P)-dependent dehydrogenase (short-subunit alcohol dehydrogenase family)
MSDLAGLVVVITGAGSGIGQAIAQGFRADGATVAGCDLETNVAVAADTCDMATVADVTAPGQMDAFADAVLAAYGKIDVAVANAGISRRGSVEDADPADVEAIYGVNVFGVLHTFRSVLPAMRRQGHGRLMAISSRTAEFCPAGGVAYSSSKAAALAIVRSLAHELAGTDILANAMFPGIARTAMNPDMGRDPALAYPTARLLATLPAGGPSGRTFADGEEYPMYSEFAADTKPPLA